MGFFLQSHKPSLTPRKTSDKCKLRDILHNPWPPPLTMVKVKGNKESLGTCPSLEEPRRADYYSSQTVNYRKLCSHIVRS